MQFALQDGKPFRAKTEAFPIFVGVHLKGGEGENSREDGNVIAMELKYKTQELNVKHLGSEEDFELKPHDARDTGRYGFVRDIRRLERHGRA